MKAGLIKRIKQMDGQIARRMMGSEDKMKTMFASITPSSLE